MSIAQAMPITSGMVGLHPLFHTPIDSAEMTGPAVLEPVVRAFSAALTGIVKELSHPR